MDLTADQQQLVLDNMGLAHTIAHSFNHPSYEHDDLSQIALEAMCRAALKYEPKRGKFTTFAGTYMRNAILKEFKHCNMHAPAVHLSLDEPIAGEATLGQVIASPNDDMEGADDKTLARQAYNVALEKLKPNKHRMFRLWVNGVRQSQIARLTNTSRTNVSRTVSDGLYAIERGMK